MNLTCEHQGHEFIPKPPEITSERLKYICVRCGVVLDYYLSDGTAASSPPYVPTVARRNADAGSNNP